MRRDIGRRALAAEQGWTPVVAFDDGVEDRDVGMRLLEEWLADRGISLARLDAHDIRVDRWHLGDDRRRYAFSVRRAVWPGEVR